mmetsp:Transcript_9612/g.14399  ORF Transcript_9612/g.14399 Transcript_9612/m.14399 type:complete len:222 (+) Transcript_9612:82-747(+)|eukprot:CAMPEP_0167762758 /NCGR_PEP_ID=MMETSP0110_2-20121227/12961_1 /TAXON_ID=629695 /ORGANISM="Gymnochlora sp., Strain CCMP2014" /LENGTH=221 /DNA_ID=CAMNT_0007649699 /DNA_START=14 /DNA_END=679 /DNA_ORIENTATION=+
MWSLFKKADFLPEKDCIKGRKEAIKDAPGKDTKHYVLKTSLYPPFPKGSEMISLGMGCFWCSEALYWDQKGIISTHVGYQQGTTPNPTYKEVCTGQTNQNEVTRIVYDPKVIPLSKILKIFFESHNPTQHLGQGNDTGTQYRSGIYYYSKDQKKIIDACLKAYQGALDKKSKGEIKTEVQLAKEFYYAEDYHQQYDAKPGSRQYCGLRPLGISMPAAEAKK